MSEDTPAEQANCFPNSTNLTPGRGGIIPPVDSRWKKGQSGNPKGRPSIGFTFIEHLNRLGDMNLSTDELVAITKNKKAGFLDKAAAHHCLMAGERPDIADFEPALDGQLSLRELRNQGIDTSTIKKTKAKVRSIPDGSGGTIHEVEREIEVHDRSKAAMSLILEHTNGKPVRAIEVSGPAVINFVVNVLGRKFIPASFQQPELPQGQQ